MNCIDFDVNEYVEYFDASGLIDWYETAMTVVN